MKSLVSRQHIRQLRDIGRKVLTLGLPTLLAGEALSTLIWAVGGVTIGFEISHPFATMIAVGIVPPMTVIAGVLRLYFEV